MSTESPHQRGPADGSERELPPSDPRLDDDECIRAELDLAAYLSGSLGPADRRALSDHLCACSYCLHAAIVCIGESPHSESLIHEIPAELRADDRSQPIPVLDHPH